jgi:hypothetical protein
MPCHPDRRTEIDRDPVTDEGRSTTPVRKSPICIAQVERPGGRGRRDGGDEQRRGGGGEE